jgi:hypothetical protein
VILDSPRVTYSVRSNSNAKHTHIVTADDGTVGYGSGFVLIKYEESFWGFHAVWLNVNGKVRGSTMGTPVTLGHHKIHEFGQKFLSTFTAVMERITRVPHALGDVESIRNFTPEDMDITTAINYLLHAAYLKMWDLDIRPMRFQDIPKPVQNNYKIIFNKEYGDTLVSPEPLVLL